MPIISLTKELSGDNPYQFPARHSANLVTIENAFQDVDNDITFLASVSGDHENRITTLETNEDALNDFFNGTFRETFDCRTTVTGGVIYATLEQSGGGDLTMQFSSGNVTLDCTPICTVALVEGTTEVPQENYVYIPESTKVLTNSTTGWPSGEHIKVAYIYAQKAAYVDSDGPLVNQNWNDHISGTDNQGHLTHITRWIRNQPAKYFSGIDGLGVDGYTTSTFGSVTIQTDSGIVSQLHPHTVHAKDTSAGDDFHVINASIADGGNFSELENLYDITSDAVGSSLSGKYFNIVLAGAANKTGEYDPLFVVLPNGSYNNLNDAKIDSSGYTSLDLPRQFTIDSGTGFLIARLTFQKTGGTWVHHSTSDLRGTLPTSIAGGAPAVTPLTNFNDNLLTIFSNTDSTKIIDFDVSTVSPATTRTLQPLDRDYVIADNADVVSMSGSFQSQIDNNYSTIVAVSGNLQNQLDTFSTDFIGLTDTPSTYTGADTYVLTVDGGNIAFTPQDEIVASATNIRGQEPCVIGQQVYTISYGQTISGAQPITSLVNPTSGSTIFVEAILDVTDSDFKVILSESPAESGYYINWITSFGDTVDLRQEVLPYSEVTTSYTTMTNDAGTVVYTTNGNSVLMNQTPQAGEHLWISNDDTSLSSIISGGVSTIQGQPTITLTPQSTYHLHFKGSNWRTI